MRQLGTSGCWLAAALVITGGVPSLAWSQLRELRRLPPTLEFPQNTGYESHGAGSSPPLASVRESPDAVVSHPPPWQPATNGSLPPAWAGENPWVAPPPGFAAPDGRTAIPGPAPSAGVPPAFAPAEAFLPEALPPPPAVADESSWFRWTDWIEPADPWARPASAGRVFQLPVTPRATDIAQQGGVPLERTYRLDVLARGFYLNDHRIEWTGQESTFAAEAVLAGALIRPAGNWDLGLEGELYLTQPFDRNILVDTPERVSYRGNFDYAPLDISQLFVCGRRGDLFFSLGKIVTPFGRTYFPVYLNDRSDAPFIRTESILWRETGLLAQWDPGPWVFTAMLTNGGPDKDANSSKAGLGRVGLDLDWLTLGASVKWQDGTGSEGQKLYKNHAGVDCALRYGRWTLSAEGIYDEYGARRPVFDPLAITWGRSIYYRDQNWGLYRPITGLGFYADLTYDGPRWLLSLNYGEFHPAQIGDPRHDAVIRRGLAKASWRITPNVEWFSIALRETDVENAQAGRLRQGIAFVSGFQWAL